MQFAGTFMVWIVAEHIGLSGILTIVAYAITIARTAPERTPARLRVPPMRCGKPSCSCSTCWRSC